MTKLARELWEDLTREPIPSLPFYREKPWQLPKRTEQHERQTEMKEDLRPPQSADSDQEVANILVCECGQAQSGSLGKLPCRRENVLRD